MATVTPLAPLTREARTALDPRAEEDVLREALSRFKQAADRESDERRQQSHALRFRSGEHVAPGTIGRGESYPAPLLTVDRQSQFIHQCVNAYRAAPLGIRVRPKGGGASKKVADILEAHIRSIEQESEAEIAYSVALDQAVGQGLGYFRLLTDYDDPLSFTRTITICPIYNRFTVYMDPESTHPAALDARWAFVVSRMSRAQFRATYNLEPVSAAQWSSTGDAAWYDQDTVQVADYYYVVETREQIVQLPTGQVAYVGAADDPLWPTRWTRTRAVWWVQLCGQAILQQERWLGTYIPVIRVEGERLDLDGRTQRTGMIQATMTPQLQVDYYTSAETEAIALAPKAPWLLYLKQIQGLEGYWNKANDSYQPYLPITDATGPDGQLLPSPQRMTVEPAIGAITQAKQGAIEDMRAALGVYAPSLGEPGKERSGVALRSQKIEADEATYHYPANLAWSIRACGVQLLELIRALHPGATALRQVAKDGDVTMAPVNQPGPDGDETLLAQGTYTVAIDVGPAYSTQREMAADKLGQLAQAQPDLAPYYSDLWVKNLDIPLADEISARLATAVPPQALAATEAKRPETRVAQLQTQLTQLGEQFKALQQQLQDSKTTEETAVQAVKLLEQQVATMQARMADKTEENALESQKNQQDHAFQMAKLDLERQKLLLDMAQMQQRAAMNGQVESDVD
jgi:hypothetical protein